MNRVLHFVWFVLLSWPLAAQDPGAEMADVLRSNGKIFTVVAVVGIVLVGLFVYLFFTERRLAKLENRLKNK
ncbi:MAG TPA: CcmD family protein [Cytophagales bacterium]|jgi:CcmD family protein|nr:CcmD family protein [Cytophagales bacterium]